MRLERLSLKISLLAFIFIFAQCNDDSFIEEVLVADDAAIEMSSKENLMVEKQLETIYRFLLSGQMEQLKF